MTTTLRRRHRWEAYGDHFYSGAKTWHCIRCGLQRITRYDSDNLYIMNGVRTWQRFAPPCPPVAPMAAAPDHGGAHE
jgi:hypothetical protein